MAGERRVKLLDVTEEDINGRHFLVDRVLHQNRHSPQLQIIFTETAGPAEGGESKKVSQLCFVENSIST